MKEQLKTKTNAIAITISLLFALVIGSGLGGAYSNTQQQKDNKDFEEYSSYVIKEEARLQSSDTTFTQLPQHYQEQQLNKIPNSLTGKQKEIATMLTYSLVSDYQDNWLNVN